MLPVVRASKLGVSLPGLGEEFHDQVRFACDIGSAVCPEQWSELMLERITARMQENVTHHAPHRSTHLHDRAVGYGPMGPGFTL
jgi:hypothetical protein